MAYNKSGPKHSGRKGRYVDHHWYDDIEVLPDDERVMPVTVAHDVVAEHPFGCECLACEAYPEALKRRLKRARLRSSGSARR